MKLYITTSILVASLTMSGCAQMIANANNQCETYSKTQICVPKDPVVVNPNSSPRVPDSDMEDHEPKEEPKVEEPKEEEPKEEPKVEEPKEEEPKEEEPKEEEPKEEVDHDHDHPDHGVDNDTEEERATHHPCGGMTCGD